MPVPFKCSVCAADVQPDASGYVFWSEGDGASVAHGACRKSRFRAPIERLRREPTGVLADVLARPNARPWYEELPVPIRALARQVFENERLSAAEGK
jgi:hypothetical protein